MSIDEIEEGQILEFRPRSSVEYLARTGMLALSEGKAGTRYVRVKWLDDTLQDSGNYYPEDFVLHEAAGDYDGKFA